MLKTCPKDHFLVEVFNTTMFSDCYYCKNCDKIYQDELKEIPKSFFAQNYNSDRFGEIKKFAEIKQAKRKVTQDDLIKLGYL